MKRLLTVASATIILASAATAQLRINEFMQSNIDLLMDDLNEFPDSWVELYNSSDQPVELSEYALGVKEEVSKAWPLPELTVEPGGFVIVYCDKASEGLHTSFRLESAKGGAIYLFRNGEVADQLTDIKKMPAPGIAWGYQSETSDKGGYQAVPTPGAPNCGHLVKDILGEPLFSEKGRVTDIPFEFDLTLALPEGSPEGTEIRYTLDGSEPTPESPLYVSPLNITGNIVRARLFCDGYLSPRSTAHSYILTDHEVTLPVVSLIAPEDYFYDDKIGILVEGSYHHTRPNSYYDWRRPVNVEFFPETGAESVVNQLAETRVKGGASRIYDLKSLVLYANKRFGTKRFEYEFFPQDAPGLTDWKSVELRNAGNDHGYLYCRDGIIQTIFGRNTSIDYQPFQPALLMINGRYVGPLNLRSRSNEDHTYTFYDGLEDIDMIENWEELKAGDWDNFNQFCQFFAEEGHTFAEYEKLMDVGEFADIMIMNLFFDNRDFPANNIVWWRPTAEGGRWRIVAKDTDFGLGLKHYNGKFPNLDWLTDPEYDEDSPKHARYARLFIHLLQTPEFRQMFINRAAIYMGDFLKASEIEAVVAKFSDMVAPEVLRYRATLDQWWMDYSEELNLTSRWIEERVPYFYTHLQRYFNLDRQVKLGIIPGEEYQSGLTLNGIEVKTGSFDGIMFAGEKIEVAAGQNAEAFPGWTAKIEKESGEESYEFPSSSFSMDLTPDMKRVSIIRSDLSGIRPVFGASDSDNAEGAFDPEKPLTAFDISGRNIGNFDSLATFLATPASPGIYILRQPGAAMRVCR